ncbi:hypothetical protein RHSIM_Rhsim07G0195000 [Rhododendron simsii]|uniref:Reverse transcriptase n=1 Tax=Rhododendron simsii TaxID=118357 RepID=A0A834GNX9_RHOSS|nr:hypothetical protein RHSIM_Rhsim07G0195000 [Rhododendron simsii]
MEYPMSHSIDPVASDGVRELEDQEHVELGLLPNSTAYPRTTHEFREALADRDHCKDNRRQERISKQLIQDDIILMRLVNRAECELFEHLQARRRLGQCFSFLCTTNHFDPEMVVAHEFLTIVSHCEANANRIRGLETEEGVWKEDLEEVEQIVLGYFTSIFTSSNPSGFEAVLNSVQQRVTPAMNAMLMGPVTKVEEGLSGLLKDAELAGRIHGVKVCRGNPSVSHLFFADNTLIFNRGNEAEVRNILAILLSYCKASAQLLDFNKSVCFFSRITPSSERNRLSQILALDIRHFSYVKDKLRSKLDGWNDHTLNPAGKEVMLSL